MALGVEMLLKAMGIDPDEIMRTFGQQVASLMADLALAKEGMAVMLARVTAIEALLERQDAKLDLLLDHFDIRPTPAPAPTTGVTVLLAVQPVLIEHAQAGE